MQKNIKEKKRHEIERMSQLTAGIANDLDVKYIVDFGSGKIMQLNDLEMCNKIVAPSNRTWSLGTNVGLWI